MHRLTKTLRRFTQKRFPIIANLPPARQEMALANERIITDTETDRFVTDAPQSDDITLMVATRLK